jgi:uncharacterized protein (DUF1778 family)
MWRTATQDLAPESESNVEVIELSREAQEHFAALLLNPPARPEALRQAMHRHLELISK